jgi:hypothetical protein
MYDADLLAAELDGRVLVPRDLGTEELDLVGAAHETGLLPGLEGAVAQVGHDGLEDAHLAPDLLHHGKGRLEGGPEAGL